MRLLLDMNLSPRWLPLLSAAGHDAVHWSQLGEGDAPDRVLRVHTHEPRRVLVTQDLDFPALSAASGSAGPSVVLLRTEDVLPPALGAILPGVLASHRDALQAGAIVVLDRARARVRILPLR